ncbi:hypothetical protein HWV62_9009 [Athelia sp. TMB]|nr:hypothetical protein HWV62_34377 [Athelia sp. TMB]KAF7983798.1 hypothetical protein HWV62_19029 [Athelia sp. TMB]KAF7985108.1 hypothetical protein HWV62_9009 [Athelia sp. TMB]
MRDCEQVAAKAPDVARTPHDHQVIIVAGTPNHIAAGLCNAADGPSSSFLPSSPPHLRVALTIIQRPLLAFRNTNWSQRSTFNAVFGTLTQTPSERHSRLDVTLNSVTAAYGRSLAGSSATIVNDDVAPTDFRDGFRTPDAPTLDPRSSRRTFVIDGMAFLVTVHIDKGGM